MNKNKIVTISLGIIIAFGITLFAYNKLHIVQAPVLQNNNETIDNKNNETVPTISTADLYIHPLKWPPEIKFSESVFLCTVGTVNNIETSLVRINGNTYCITSLAQGAAGSTYTEYTYTREYKNKTVSVEFTIQSVQCMNYDEPNQTECKNKQASYNVSKIVDDLFAVK